MSTFTVPREAYELLVQAFDGDERRARLVARAIEIALQAFMDGEWSEVSRGGSAHRDRTERGTDDATDDR